MYLKFQATVNTSLAMESFDQNVARFGKSVAKRRASYGSESMTLAGLHDPLVDRNVDNQGEDGHNLQTNPRSSHLREQQSDADGRRKWRKNDKLPLPTSSTTPIVPLDVVEKVEYSLESTLQETISLWSSQETSKTNLMLSERGQLLATFGSGSSIQIFGTNSIVKSLLSSPSDGGIPGTVNPFSRLMGHSGPIRSLSFSHHSQDFLLSSSEDKSIQLWDVGGGGKSLGQIKHKLRSDRERVAVFPDTVVKTQFYFMDQFVLSASANKLFIHRLELEEISARDSRSTCQLSHIKTLAMSQCKFITDFTAVNHFYSYLAICACSDKGVRIMDFNNQAICFQLNQAHTRPVHQVLIPSNGQNAFLSVAIGDGAKIWDLRSGQCCQRIDWPNTKRTNPGLDWSPCSNYLATGNEDGIMYIFDIRHLKSFTAKIAPNNSSPCGITDAKFHPQKPFLFSGFASGQLGYYSMT